MTRGACVGAARGIDDGRDHTHVLGCGEAPAIVCTAAVVSADTCCDDLSALSAAEQAVSVKVSIETLIGLKNAMSADRDRQPNRNNHKSLVQTPLLRQVRHQSRIGACNLALLRGCEMRENRMRGLEESNQSDPGAARRRRPFQEALQPGDLTHHALLRDVPPQTIPWILRDLRRRLYDVQTSGPADSQRLAMRQGFPLWWGAMLFACGWFLLAGSFATGSDLGRGFQLLDGSGSTAQAAAPVLFNPMTMQATSFLLWSGLALLAISLFLSICPRKHLFLVIQKNDSNLLDLWISGTSWRHETRFDREFRDLTRQIERHCQGATQDEPQASHQGP